MKFRHSIARFVLEYRWYLLGAAALLAFGLGLMGWPKFLAQIYPGRPVHCSDAIYWSLKDFFTGSPSQPGLPVELDVARFLAPAVAGISGLNALGLLFRDRWQQLKIPLRRNHIIVCGLGDVGSAFVRHLHEKRIHVVVIELDPANPNVELCRRLGTPVIVGDAQRQRILEAAGAQHANRVLAMTPDDAVNTQIVANVRALPRRRSRELRCLALITNPEFCRLLRVQESRRGDPALSVDFINIDETGARLLLEDFPLDFESGQPHIVVAHLDPLGVWLIYHAARAWFEHRGEDTNPLVVTVLDEQPSVRIDALLGQHPALEKVCKFLPFTTSTRDIGLLRQHHLDPTTPPISCAYVTAYRDDQVFETALKLRHELDPAIPVVAAFSRTQGVTVLLDDVTVAGGLVNFAVFSGIERTATVELVRGGSFEPLAHAIHEVWRREQLDVGRSPTAWEDLDESRQESNRHQARHIPVKLRSVDCAIAPLQDWAATDFEFTAEELEVLAIAEHERWNRERLADGWTLIDMPEADNAQEAKDLLEEAKRRKETPYLLSWETLVSQYPDVAEWDRLFVRKIPAILASAGLQVIRVPTQAAVNISADGEGFKGEK